MPDNDDLDAIRQQKAEQLKQTLTNDTAAPATDTPTEPIRVDGEDHLTQLLQQHPVVLADFHADWCGPCKMLEPTIAELATDTPAAVAKIDIDANQSLAAAHNVRGVPTLILFANGEPAERIVGVRDKAQYEQLIAKHAA